MRVTLFAIIALFIMYAASLAQDVAPEEASTPVDSQGRPLPAYAPQLARGEIMVFPYASNLEWCIRNSFAANGIANPYTTPITGDMVSKIRHISCYSPVPKVPEHVFDPDRNNTVRSLQGIEYFHNLETLVIDGFTEIEDLYYLSGLPNLTKVDIKNSRIKDISPLAYNRLMKRVLLDNNSVTDLSPLAGLKDLKELSLRYQAPDYITNISSLAGKTTLAILDLQGNKLEDISSLANQNLRILNLRDNRLTSIEALRSVSTLESIDISINMITDISPLASSKANLQTINAAHNGITNIDFITEPMPKLTVLKLSDNQIVDITPITKIDPRGRHRLELLLDKNNITDIMPLRDLANLFMIYIIRLSYNCIEGVDSIQFLHDSSRIPYTFIGRQCVDRPAFTEENTDAHVVNRDQVTGSQ
ncbi:MAG: leucine-rich repeat domain-containing protein [Deferribacteraceae bacterium]|nr:leucine-rich repeat domain-containing protein [Deferribacteraceae bacterium]